MPRTRVDVDIELPEELTRETLPIGPGMSGLDEEIAELIWALNRLPGVRTEGSCCGHDESPIRIWLHHSTDLYSSGGVCLARVICDRYWFHGMAWELKLWHGDTHPIVFVLESVGQGGLAYKSAERMAEVINQHVDDDPDLAYNILKRGLP